MRFLRCLDDLSLSGNLIRMKRLIVHIIGDTSLWLNGGATIQIIATLLSHVLLVLQELAILLDPVTNVDTRGKPLTRHRIQNITSLLLASIHSLNLNARITKLGILVEVRNVRTRIRHIDQTQKEEMLTRNNRIQGETKRHREA